MRILWIEDKPEQIQRFVEILRKEHEVVQAGTGEAGLDAIDKAREQQQDFDIVLLDIMLPKGHGNRINPDVRQELMGKEILRTMNEQDVSCPVVGVSAVADQQLRDRIRQEYPFVSEILKKPVGMDELEAEIRRAVENT